MASISGLPSARRLSAESTSLIVASSTTQTLTASSAIQSTLDALDAALPTSLAAVNSPSLGLSDPRPSSSANIISTTSSTQPIPPASESLRTALPTLAASQASSPVPVDRAEVESPVPQTAARATSPPEPPAPQATPSIPPPPQSSIDATLISTSAITIASPSAPLEINSSLPPPPPLESRTVTASPAPSSTLIVSAIVPPTLPNPPPPQPPSPPSPAPPAPPAPPRTTTLPVAIIASEPRDLTVTAITPSPLIASPSATPSPQPTQMSSIASTSPTAQITATPPNPLILIPNQPENTPSDTAFIDPQSATLSTASPSTPSPASTTSPPFASLPVGSGTESSEPRAAGPLSNTTTVAALAGVGGVVLLAVVGAVVVVFAAAVRSRRKRRQSAWLAEAGAVVPPEGSRLSFLSRRGSDSALPASTGSRRDATAAVMAKRARRFSTGGGSRPDSVVVPVFDVRYTGKHHTNLLDMLKPKPQQDTSQHLRPPEITFPPPVCGSMSGSIVSAATSSYGDLASGSRDSSVRDSATPSPSPAAAAPPRKHASLFTLDTLTELGSRTSLPAHRRESSGPTSWNLFGGAPGGSTARAGGPVRQRPSSRLGGPRLSLLGPSAAPRSRRSGGPGGAIPSITTTGLSVPPPAAAAADLPPPLPPQHAGLLSTRLSFQEWALAPMPPTPSSMGLSTFDRPDRRRAGDEDTICLRPATPVAVADDDDDDDETKTLFPPTPLRDRGSWVTTSSTASSEPPAAQRVAPPSPWPAHAVADVEPDETTVGGGSGRTNGTFATGYDGVLSGYDTEMDEA
ncbi:hypothetical protein HDU96_006656 [Phlyctochytrium bullatum]|nr:hypothetical protein HDU96_006656 [Phlyctochytrium bullatum]